jgi:hypothetical protein
MEKMEKQVPGHSKGGRSYSYRYLLSSQKGVGLRQCTYLINSGALSCAGSEEHENRSN